MIMAKACINLDQPLSPTLHVEVFIIAQSLLFSLYNAKEFMIFFRCTELGLINRCEKISSREGTEEEILTKHTPQQIEILKATQYEKNEEKLETLSSKYDAVYINQSSYQMSLLSVGCAIDLVDAVCKGDIQNGMAIIRYESSSDKKKQ